MLHLVKVHERWTEKFPEGTIREWSKSMSLEALSFLDEQETYWTFVAARIHLADVYEQVAIHRGDNSRCSVWKVCKQCANANCKRALRQAH